MGKLCHFLRLGIRDSDRWRIKKVLFTTCQCPWCPISEKSDLTPWILILSELKTCSCLFVRYFCTLFWDDITIISWWKLSKQSSYWSKTSFFSQLKKWTIFPSQSNVRNYCTKGHELNVCFTKIILGYDHGILF